MPNYTHSEVFNCIDILHENCGIIGKLNKRINDIITVSGEGYIFSRSLDVGGSAHNTYYYPTKDGNALSDVYNPGRFEKGNFIKHIYTGTLSTNVNQIIVAYDVYQTEAHDITLDICEVKHDVYTGTETTDLPSLGSTILSLPSGNSKGSFSFNVSLTEPKTITLRLYIAGEGHGNEQVTVASTVYGTA
jgi:hypothetical protein